jgi:predicted XRE-type DNA-binding protein
MKKKLNDGTTSGNVFDDTGLPNAEEHLVKAELVYRIDRLMKSRGLKQVDAAKLLGVKQPDVSKMLRGNFRQFSVERLLRFLVALGEDVQILVMPYRGAPKGPQLRVVDQVSLKGAEEHGKRPKRPKDLVKWLEYDEARSRPYRAARLRTLLDCLGHSDDGTLFWGGTNSFQAFVELKLAYIHGLYLATVLLSLSCIEQEIAGSFHAGGMDDAATATLSSLLDVALEQHFITKAEYEAFNRLRAVRNSYTHFRAPMHRTHIAQRALASDTSLDEVLESDALLGVKAITSFLARGRRRVAPPPPSMPRRKRR